MKRTKLSDRVLPDYTRAEETMNMVTHIIGGAFGVLALTLCVIISALHHDPWGVVGSAIYGATLIILYTCSSVYHGLRPEKPKKVMQVVDHCVIYLLIAGTYTPVLFCAIRPAAPVLAWTLFGFVWGLAAVGAAFTAIDLKKYGVFSMACYIGMGWCIVLAGKTALSAIPLPGLLWLLAGGIAYTIGAVLYGIGKRRRYMHTVFHVFVLLGSVFQFFTIAGYIL